MITLTLSVICTVVLVITIVSIAAAKEEQELLFGVFVGMLLTGFFTVATIFLYVLFELMGVIS